METDALWSQAHQLSKLQNPSLALATKTTKIKNSTHSHNPSTLEIVCNRTWSCTQTQDIVSMQQGKLFRCLRLTTQVEFKSWAWAPSMIRFSFLISISYAALLFMPFSIVVLFYKAGMQEDTFREQQFMHSYTTRAHAHFFHSNTHTHTLSMSELCVPLDIPHLLNSSRCAHSCCKDY